MSYSAFSGFDHISTGPLAQVYAACGPDSLIFDRETGRVVDIDPRFPPSEEGPRPGRPKLGVTPREVTLLPRHWEWLATQPGGASVALRKLVEQARKSHSQTDRLRCAQERAYRFMSTMAGDFPGFEEASRALFANDPLRLKELIAGWPEDVRDHALALTFGEDDPSPSQEG